MLRYGSHLYSIWMLLVCSSSMMWHQSGSHTHAPTHSEDSCRDEHGRVDLGLERMVMGELGLHELLDYCWNGVLTGCSACCCLFIRRSTLVCKLPPHRRFKPVDFL